jgi:hypothetical protein
MFQVRASADGTRPIVNVFADYFEDGPEASAYGNGLAISGLARERTGVDIRTARVSMDPAHRQRNAVGVVILGEYKRAGCIGANWTVDDWPVLGPARPKADVLALLESLLLSADDRVGITVHPRCKRLIEALKCYARKRSPDGQWLDDPLDPQHPHEDMIDPLCGGLSLEMPRGLAPEAPMKRVQARRVIG